jgi:shikimate kinase
LAKRLGCSFVDTDVVIEAEQGRAIREIFVFDGEPAFRDLERAAVARALSECDGVVSLGGGAPMDSRTQGELEGHTVVFLDVGIADAARRVGFNVSRPLLGLNPRAQWSRIMQVRRPTYDAVASARVDTAGRPPQAVVDEIAALVEGQ